MMEEVSGFPFEWLLGLLMLCGLLFWISLLFSPKVTDSFAAGLNWLEWRPLPHDLSKVMLCGFLVTLLLQNILGVVLAFLPGFDQLPTGVVILLSIFIFQGLLAWILFRHFHRRRLHPLQVLGMENPLEVSDLIFGLATYCMCLPWILLASLITKLLFTTLDWKIDLQPIVQQMSEVDGWMNWVTLFLLVGFIAPLLEEVVFRGVVFTWLYQRTGTVPGLVIQALLFAVVHSHAPSFLALFSLALVLGLTYIYTRRLMACVWAHAIFNTMSLCYTLFGAGLEDTF